MKRGLIYGLHCFNFYTDVVFYNVKYKVRESDLQHQNASRLCFRFCFIPRRVMNLRNVKSNNKISCKKHTGQP